MTYEKVFFFLLYYVFFAVQSESEIRFFAVEPINTCFFFFFFFFFLIEEIGKGRWLHNKGVQEYIRYHEYIASK